MNWWIVGIILFWLIGGIVAWHTHEPDGYRRDRLGDPVRIALGVIAILAVSGGLTWLAVVTTL